MATRGRSGRTTRSGEAQERTCASCGRRIEPRRSMRGSWDEVRWCSDACRRRKVRGVDVELERAISSLLAARARSETICPSEAARRVAAEHEGAADDEGWRELMEPARRAARRMVARGEVEIVQRGVVVDPSTARGPIRIRVAH